MENSLDGLELKHDVSSYSSFYKTQTSLHRDKSKMSENTVGNHENDITYKSVEKDDIKTGETSILDHSDNDKKTLSDMNNNSNDNKESFNNGTSGSQYNKEEDDQLKEMQSTLNIAKDKPLKEVREITKENKDNENEMDNDVNRSKEKELSGSQDVLKHQQEFTGDKPSLPDDRHGDKTVTNANVQSKQDVSKDDVLKVEPFQNVKQSSKASDDKTVAENIAKTEDNPAEIPGIIDDLGKDSGETRLRDGSPDLTKSLLINENQVKSRETSMGTSEKDDMRTKLDDEDNGTEKTGIQEITKQGNEGTSLQQSVTKTEDGDYTAEVMDIADKKSLLRKTDTPSEGITNSGQKVSVSENDPSKSQARENDESKIRIDGSPLSSYENEKVSIPLHNQNDDIYQMPDIEKENISDIVLKEENEKHGEETVTNLKEPSIPENVIIKKDERKTENKDNRSVSGGKDTPVLETEYINGTRHPDESDKRNEEENGDARSVFGETKISVIQEDIVSAATHFDNSNTKDTGNSSENISLKKGDIPKSSSSTYDNLYFTGRLPSLLSRDESLQSISNKKAQGGEAIVEETEQMVKTETSKMSRESEERSRASEKNIESPPNVYDDRTHDVGDGGRGNKSDVRDTPTPSRKIRELIEEMKGPSTSVDPRSKRTKDASEGAYKSDMFTKAINEVQEANEPVKNEQNDNNSENANMTVEDINMVTTKVLGTTYAEDRQSRFDNMPHMKQIEDYVQGNLKTEQTPSTTESADGEKLDRSNVNTVRTTPNEIEHKQTANDRITNENDVLPHRTKRSPQLSPQKQREIELIKSKDQFDDQKHQHEPYDMQPKIEKQEHKQVQSISSETDLKAIIASAKIAISNGTKTTESQSGFGTSDTSGLTLQGDNMSMVRKRTRSRATSKGVWSTSTQSGSQEALASLICSNCLQVNSNVHSAGYCTDCQKYLCNTCVTVHTVDNDTRFHEIVPSYCKNELAINKYIPATGYCADCSMFLCTKCVVQHTGFRTNRHHRIIQSSFVSKPTDRQAETDEFLDEVQNKMDPNDSKTSVRSKKERKKKRKLLSDLDNSNPYSFPSSHVPESLYPGPNKKLSSSYTKNPKWVHSSIPSLPYLVQPKPIPDRIFHAAGHHRPLMIYTKPKTGLDAMAAKLKLLKSRYKIKDGARTVRRREQALFTARPVKVRDDLSLPDAGSLKSHISGRRSVKHSVEHDTSVGRKEVEFINEHCLSIPFPRGEKRTDIQAMTILSNGKLAVLDKNNNNIKLYNKTFHCMAALQLQNRLVDICASNLCPTDIYAATPKHIYEVSAQKGLDVTRQMKIEIKRIEGIVCWKYGLAVISKKTNITWELRLLDYRGYLKSKLEIFNPFTLDIASSTLHHMTSSRGGKYISLSDTKNSCIITVDVTTRVVVHETMLEEGKSPSYVTSDGEGNHNLYVTCDNKVFQISRQGKVLGVLIDKAKENGEIGCIIYNKQNDRMYVKTGKDMISVYQIYF